jgi:hypothetical protein
MLKGNSRVSRPPPRRPRAPSHQQKWRIKAAETGCERSPAGEAGGPTATPYVGRLKGTQLVYAGKVERLLRRLPMRLIPIGKPHVHHEGISIIGALDLIGAG